MTERRAGFPAPATHHPPGLKRTLALIVGAVGTGALAAVLLLPTGPALWRDGTMHGRWRAVFDGYGTTTGGDRRVSLSPRAATSDNPADTHSALVVTVASYRSFTAVVRLRTDRQFRPVHPNPWEVGWVLWHFTDRRHFYAVVLKPNGWELSKEDPGYAGGQRFLASGVTPTFPLGRWHTVTVSEVGDTITVGADGTTLASYADLQNPYTGGAVGLYSEDARADFELLRLEATA